MKVGRVLERLKLEDAKKRLDRLDDLRSGKAQPNWNGELANLERKEKDLEDGKTKWSEQDHRVVSITMAKLLPPPFLQQATATNYGSLEQSFNDIWC
ncbi:4598_t:CDS:2 [Paraglomus brasilianum]|uniref:4598_t:CDS:1 n=1 Tax=Paraglomus brasilianum TaxID=144538 RepID=A0A9N9H582_9GLOM|nr:4598_t:CDS:2 [Paraglomus brasilianum]